MRLTVGPLPASVYWRRRAIVLAGALLVLFLVAQACMGMSGGGAAGDEPPAPPATGTGAPGPTGAIEPTGSTEPVEAVDPATGESATGQPDGSAAPAGDECTDQEVAVLAQAARSEFTAGEPVRFTIVIRNQSDRACWRDIGGSLRELYLKRGTGADQVWSSRDCGAPEGSDARELAPGFETSYFLVWDGRASDTCDGDEAGGDLLPEGEYQLFARLGTVYSDPVALTLR